MVNFHKPVVGAKASRYVLIMTLSFAICVVATRVYLEATGYPQIGNATFHFAHALWGGLLQIIASLLMFIVVNRWARDVSAVLAGVGVGMFIDEIGKFITQQNDYFFPLAAPIIYLSFLLILIVYLILKRRQSVTNLHADMYQLLSELEEVLEDDLSVSERDSMLARLKEINSQTNRPDVAELARHIGHFLRSDAVIVKPDRPSKIGNLAEWIRHLEDRFLSRRLSRWIFIILFLLNGLLALLVLFTLIIIVSGNRDMLPEVLGTIVVSESNVTGLTSFNWYLIMIGLNLLTGILQFIGAVAFIIKRDATAIALGVVSLIITLTFINTLSFYYDQFSILLDSIYAFLILLALQRYRDRFLRKELP